MKFFNKLRIICLVFFLFPIISFNTTTAFSQETFYIRLKKIIIGKDSLYYQSDLPKTSPNTLILPYHVNSISFEVQSSDTSGHPSFQYLLKGYDQEWNEWKPENKKSYINLLPGKYTFFARAKNVPGELTESLQYKFFIRKNFFSTFWAYLIYTFTLVFLFIVIYKQISYRYEKDKFKLERIINRRTEELIKAKEESEKLLANVLPPETLKEIKSKGKASHKKFEMVTVLFSDIQGFTRIAEHMNPESLIDLLDKFFFYFDSVVDKYGIEKIKTIGDAYMCAGGIPEKNRTNPIDVIMAALEMQKYMHELQIESAQKNMQLWDIRIGIHTGSVIAGVVGQKRLSYDIWGDTVNTASRMESSGKIGKINISGSTYELVKDFYICQYRGKMPVKYKGEIDMYFVKGIRPELTNSENGLPNRLFYIRLQLLRLLDLEEHITQKYEKEFPQSLYFHNIYHLIHVYTQVELLGRAEGISDEYMLLLRTAALLHDSGFMDSYENHLKYSAEFAKEILPKYSYTEKQISIICKLIMSTKKPFKPENLLESILCDANLDYIGRVDYIEFAEKLFKEREERGLEKNRKKWFMEQLALIKNHEFFTETAKRLRDVSKIQQERNIQEYIKELTD